jgi:hypothetical protein
MKLRSMGIAFGVICLVVGLGTVVSPASLLRMCRTDCWFNGLLYAVLGEPYGKFLLGALWYAGGAWFIYRGVFGWQRDAKTKENAI